MLVWFTESLPTKVPEAAAPYPRLPDKSVGVYDMLPGNNIKGSQPCAHERKRDKLLEGRMDLEFVAAMSQTHPRPNPMH